MRSVKRFAFVDGLRGVAAMMVVLYHFWENLPDASQSGTPRWLVLLFENGNLGVDVFFVLSGFVIAHSVRRADFSLSYVLRFGLRRSIRLDPPLWATIALEVALIHVGLLLLPSLGTPVPSTLEVLANVAYLQRFLGMPDVVPVFWSLTYEVQFYLVLIVALTVLQPRRAGRVARAAASLIFLVSIAYSLSIWLHASDLPLQGLFIDRWSQFGLGVLAWACVERIAPPWTLVAVLVGSAVAAVLLAPTTYRLGTVFVTVVTTSLLAYAGRRERMHWLSGSTIQFLGRISYSLYLLHLPIGWRAMTLAQMSLGDEISGLMGYATLVLGVGASIASAWLMYEVIEAPSIGFARRVPLPTVLEDSEPGR